MLSRFQNLKPEHGGCLEGQIFKSEQCSATVGEVNTGRAVAAEGRRERYRGPPDHQTRRSECYRPTLVDELQSAVSTRLSCS